MSVFLHPLAEREFQAALRSYSRQSLMTARNFQAAFDAAVQRIASHPHLGSPYRGGSRWVRIGRYQYVIYYLVLDPNQTVVYAIAHARRRPGYWLHRTRWRP